MRAYLLNYTVDGTPKKKVADTQKGARTLRRNIMAESSLKLTDINIEQVEIPSKKTDFLSWLNTMLG